MTLSLHSSVRDTPFTNNLSSFSVTLLIGTECGHGYCKNTKNCCTTGLYNMQYWRHVASFPGHQPAYHRLQYGNFILFTWDSLGMRLGGMQFAIVKLKARCCLKVKLDCM